MIIIIRAPVAAHMLYSDIGYIWWPSALLSNCPVVDPLLPLRDL